MAYDLPDRFALNRHSGAAFNVFEADMLAEKTSSLGHHGRLDEQAMAAYKEVVRLQPNAARAYFLLGWAANGMDRFSEAIEPLQHAARLAPDRPEAHSELGFTYRNLKRYDEAAVEYKRAITIDPKFAPAHHGLGVTYWKLGNKAAAQQQYAILQGLDRAWASKLAQALAQ